MSLITLVHSALRCMALTLLSVGSAFLLSCAGSVSKWLNILSKFFHRPLDPSFWFSETELYSKSQPDMIVFVSQ